MNSLEKEKTNVSEIENNRNERGSAIVIAIFVLALVSVFVALALSRTASEAAALGNETTEARTFYAAQGSLEMMTRNFNKVFETKLSPSDADLNAVRNGVEPGLNAQYTFNREVDLTEDSQPAILTDKSYAGLYAIRDYWRLRTTATDTSGIQVQLTRNILNNRIPIFQFGIFYDDDLELYRPPRFNFGGRVHSNRHFFLSPGADGVYFDSQVTAVGHIITQTWRNGNQSDINNNQTFIKNASQVDQQLLPTKGSVLNTTAGAADNIFAMEPDLPPSKLNPNWTTDSAIFDGNLKRGVPRLKLPVQIGADAETNNDLLIEMIRRGKKVANSSGGDLFKNDLGALAPVAATDEDNDILKAERFANKTGIRVSLADSQAKLPGCASGIGTAPIAGNCGIRLDGNIEGKVLPLIGSNPPTVGTTALNARGYQPASMKKTSGSGFNYVPTRVNGERLFNNGLEAWIKVETVQTNPTTGAIETRDITEDFLSMGVTEQAPRVISINNYENPEEINSLTATTPQTPTTGTDSRSVIKIQRFAIPGVAIPGDSFTGTATVPSGTSRWLYPYSGYNFVVRFFSNLGMLNTGCTVGVGCKSVNEVPTSPDLEKLAHIKVVSNWSGCDAGVGAGACRAAIVPFPIQMFDTREGTFYDNAGVYDTTKVTKNGVMSLIEIDIANLRRFLRGDFNGLFPTTTPFAVSKGNVGLVNTDIPQNNGWVLYISDRRGDRDFDGEYDMEDIYGYGYNSATSRYYGSDGVLQAGEAFLINV